MTPASQRVAIPVEFANLAEMQIMAGEDQKQFEALRWMIIGEVSPKSPLQRLLCLDLVEQSWDVLRYRRLKQRILATRRECAIRAVLEKIDGAGVADSDRVESESAKAAPAWRDDPHANSEIERRLTQAGYNQQEIDAEVFVQAGASFLLLDRLMHAVNFPRDHSL